MTLSDKSAEYTGEAVESVTISSVKVKKTIIDPGTYRVFYLNNVNKGTATVVVMGDGKNTSGCRTKNFTIKASRGLFWSE